MVLAWHSFRKKNADNLDFSSVFYFNFIVSLLLYACMFLSAPFIANFYDNPVLTPLVRILSLTLVLSGLKYIQQTFVSKHMLFRKLFFSTLGGTLFSAIPGIILAAVGFSTWALVAQYICSAAIDVLIL